MTDSESNLFATEWRVTASLPPLRGFDDLQRFRYKVFFYSGALSFQHLVRSGHDAVTLRDDLLKTRQVSQLEAAWRHLTKKDDLGEKTQLLHEAFYRGALTFSNVSSRVTQAGADRLVAEVAAFCNLVKVTDSGVKVTLDDLYQDLVRTLTSDEPMPASLATWHARAFYRGAGALLALAGLGPVPIVGQGWGERACPELVPYWSAFSADVDAPDDVRVLVEFTFYVGAYVTRPFLDGADPDALASLASEIAGHLAVTEA